MFKRKDKKILENTKRIARGTFFLSVMPNTKFITIYKRKEKEKVENPCPYQIPDWFTIKFIEKDKDICEFLGSFHEGEGYPLVYKKNFLKELKKFRVFYEQIDNETYKILRKGV